MCDNLIALCVKLFWNKHRLCLSQSTQSHQVTVVSQMDTAALPQETPCRPFRSGPPTAARVAEWLLHLSTTGHQRHVCPLSEHCFESGAVHAPWTDGWTA